MIERVFVSPLGNVFMREIAEHLVEGLASKGHRPALITDALPSGADPFANLVVAPHEFFHLFPATVGEKMAGAASAVSVNTEQPGTPFFDIALPYLAAGPATLDINELSLAEQNRRGFNAAHLPLGVVPSMDHWGGGDGSRSIDVGFLAGRTTRREEFIGASASVLWEWNCDLRFFSWHAPATGESRSFVHGEAKYRALADTRVLLNVHRDETMYFEWARVLDALANGCVVASENSVGLGPLVPGEHFLMDSIDDLAERAVALLFDEPRRREMARAAHHLAFTDLHQGTLAEKALLAVREQAHVPSRRRPSTRPGTASSTTLLSRARQFLTIDSQQARQTTEATASSLKQAWLRQLATVRSLERAAALVAHGDPDHCETSATPSYSAVSPDVTVVIPLYHQGQYVIGALSSVAAASGADLVVDTVVVDDHSLDGSAEVVLDYMRTHPWQPVQLVRRAANGGLPVARNTGFTAARAAMVFAMDADNELRPNGLRKLAAVLGTQPDDVVATYGLLERFDDHESLGVLSHLPWDPDLLSWGNFIDAMALWRKSAWSALGGFADDPGIYGWEDYDMWLSTAERGWRAELVPQLVGKYREQGGSMRKVSDVDMEANYDRLRLRHPGLVWRT